MEKIKQEIIQGFTTRGQAYLDKGFVVIPEKRGMKSPSIKEWTTFSTRKPTEAEVKSWMTNFPDAGLSIMLGEVSGVVALDIDETRQEVLDLILPLLPSSPVVKVGAKGETRFFRYVKGTHTDKLAFNGEMVVEILSDNKKTHLPPSLHPSGVNYKWTGEQELLDVDVNSLPILPPALLSHIGSKLRLHFPDVEGNKNKYISGRNDTLSSLCGKLIQEGVAVDTAIRKLVEFDLHENKPPLFSDPEERRHTEPFTNALEFYTNHLSSVNTKRYRNNEEYEIPMTASAINHTIEEVRLGKSQKQEKQKSSKRPELPVAQGVLKTLKSNIEACSWVKQPNLAFSASLALMASLVSRKVQFGGMSPNLYVLNISPSGSGKDAPQQKIKEYLIDINGEAILGSGDYGSDAGLTDSLETRPVRLDIMDEAGGILKTVNSGKADYNGKMADILAELWSCSTGYYMGRSLADGNKGSCYRPNVNILASTTPTGFTEGVSIQAIEKGLLGRFLIFLGDGDTRAERLRDLPRLDTDTLNQLRFWYSYQAPENDSITVKGIKQYVATLEAEEEAHGRLDEIFTEFDNRRRNSDPTDPLLPIIARMYQQLIKITIIHACSRANCALPRINKSDVEFGYLTVLNYFSNMEEIVENYVFNSRDERETKKVLSIIKKHTEGISKTDLYKKTRGLNKRSRDAILQDLVESEEVYVEQVSIGNKPTTVYRSR